jgi:DUF4097 and DUF4098 domain-containing protein YvlB
MSIRHLTVAAIAVIALTSAPAVFAGVQNETEVVDRTIPLPANGTLRLKNFSGDITITGTSGRDVVMKATRRATRDRLDHIKLAVETSGSTVTINANERDQTWRNENNNVVETAFDIQVPASARLEVDAFSSAVIVKGVTGAERVKTFSGRITIDGAQGAVEAESFSGALHVDVTAAGADPDLRLTTFNSRIDARLSDRARGSVRFDTFSGDFDSDFPLALRSIRRRGGLAVDLPAGSGKTLEFHTFSGDVKLNKS